MSELPTGGAGDVFSVKEQRWISPGSRSRTALRSTGDPGQTSGEAGQSAAVQAARDAFDKALLVAINADRDDLYDDSYANALEAVDNLCAAVAREAIAQLPCFWTFYEGDMAQDGCTYHQRDTLCPTCEARAT